jgi:hypothetical protein
MESNHVNGNQPTITDTTASDTAAMSTQEQKSQGISAG